MNEYQEMKLLIFSFCMITISIALVTAIAPIFSKYEKSNYKWISYYETVLIYEIRRYHDGNYKRQQHIAIYGYEGGWVRIE